MEKNIPSENINTTKKDYYLGTVAGFFIGLLVLPILRAANYELYNQLAFVIIPVFVIGTPLGLVIASWISQKISIVWQISKFGIIGVLNTFVDLGILAFLSYIFKQYFLLDSKDILFNVVGGITFYSFYKSISFILANINSYVLNKYWTFKDIKKKSRAEYLQFFTISVIAYLINVIIASYVFKDIQPIGGLKVEQWELIGGAIGSLAGLTWNFIGYKFIVFKK